VVGRALELCADRCAGCVWLVDVWQTPGQCDWLTTRAVRTRRFREAAILWAGSSLLCQCLTMRVSVEPNVISHLVSYLTWRGGCTTASHTSGSSFSRQTASDHRAFYTRGDEADCLIVEPGGNKSPWPTYFFRLENECACAFSVHFTEFHWWHILYKGKLVYLVSVDFTTSCMIA